MNDMAVFQLNVIYKNGQRARFFSRAYFFFTGEFRVVTEIYSCYCLEKKESNHFKTAKDPG